MKSNGLRRANHVACMEGMKNAYKILVRTPLGTPVRRWEDSVSLRDKAWSG
jgi:hypothetical protein